MSTKDLRNVIDKYSDKIMRKRNVVAIMPGKKIVHNRELDKECIRVYVSEKVLKEDLSEDDLVQPTYDGYETDVIEVGRIKAF